METSEEKIERLRTERELEILKKKYQNEGFYLNDIGELSRYGWGKNILHVDMIVKIMKPDKTWRRGIIEYIKLENGFPRIGVICGKNKIKFEKTWRQVVPDNTIEDIVAWENLEVPERLKKMTTTRLLTEFRKRKKSLRNNEEELIYKKELYLREHVGQTNSVEQKKIRQNKVKTKNGKRH